MSLFIDDRQNYMQLNIEVQKLLERVVIFVLDYEKKEQHYEISLSLVDNDEIKELNNRYRQINSPTDVLSFPLIDFKEDSLQMVTDDGEVPLGDIIISTQKAKEQAEEYGHSFERELSFLVVHGMLHLLGYDHKEHDYEKQMFDKQDKILLELNINR